MPHEVDVSSIRDEELEQFVKDLEGYLESINSLRLEKVHSNESHRLNPVGKRSQRPQLLLSNGTLCRQPA